MNDANALPIQLGGVQALFNGTQAQIFQVAPFHVICVVPGSFATQKSATVQVVSASGSATPLILLNPSFPTTALLSVAFPQLPPAGSVDGVIRNHDGTLNSATNPESTRLGTNAAHLVSNSVGIAMIAFVLRLILPALASKWIRPVSALLVCAFSALALSPVGSPRGFAPKDGFVPTATVALAIADAVLIPVYGRDLIDSERPFKAVLDGGTWTVTGSVPCNNPPPGAVCPGGAAELRISKKTGQILFMTHYE